MLSVSACRISGCVCCLLTEQQLFSCPCWFCIRKEYKKVCKRQNISHSRDIYVSGCSAVHRALQKYLMAFVLKTVRAAEAVKPSHCGQRCQKNKTEAEKQPAMLLFPAKQQKDDRKQMPWRKSKDRVGSV